MNLRWENEEEQLGEQTKGHPQRGNRHEEEGSVIQAWETEAHGTH